ncbi:HNH endonuclease family protein [Kutzneria viridogrisea]|uniref:GmrSD restriction endonucleases C-terminal domain-containing protein n=2 Tax=Kutzneria TaxID=43356 RepID=W5WM54_9PSEU|nr:HNH endonuclease family protein [Kutzneria albida]AHI01953.1 hypothetical protein KALB_8596 [Kutzneria albida DSM 43870]MBA8929624.1 hypothetical protein [Kutzneria viridogrisea]
MNSFRAVRGLLAAGALSVVAVLGVSTPASATPPNIPDKTTAVNELNGLRVQPDGSSAGYSRDKFKHWITIEGSCNTREMVLKRDGTNVQTDSSCAAKSGTWYSPYDGSTQTSASAIQIDHMVPLADAWRTGASGWTAQRRQDFANDLSYPQLVAVKGAVNESKGDKSPDLWKPPLTSYWCTYAKMWTHVKSKYSLTVNSAEKSALQDMLGRC